MRVIINCFIYLSIAFLLLQNQLLLAIAAIVFFTMRVGAVWLIPLGVLLDGYFGAYTEIPVLSLSFLLWYIVSEFIKPRLLVQS